MNFVDILILIPIGYAAWKGFQHGIIIEIFTLLALLVGIYVGIHFSDYTAKILRDNFNWDSAYLPVVAFTLTFLGVGAMVYFAGKVVEKMVKVTQLTPINKVFGILFSVFKMTFFISVFIVLIESYDEKGAFVPKTVKEESLLYQPVSKVSTFSIPALKNSSIFVQNLFHADTTQLNLQELLRAKEIADSLGIDANDGKQLYEIHKRYEQTKP